MAVDMRPVNNTYIAILLKMTLNSFIGKRLLMMRERDNDRFLNDIENIILEVQIHDELEPYRIYCDHAHAKGFNDKKKVKLFFKHKRN